MAITAHDRIDLVTPVSSKKSFWARAWKAITNAQLAKANREISIHLQALDDKTLQKLGYTYVEIREIRTRGLF